MGRFLLIRGLAAALAPFAILLVLATVASMLAYGILRIGGDIFSLPKVISKATLVLLLLSIFPLKHYLKYNWADLGFAPKPQFFKQVGQGMALGLFTLLPVLLCLYWLDVHVWDSSRVWTIGKVSEKVALALFFATLIALGEEILFRGILLTSLRDKMPILAAAGLSSVYYAALHFLKNKSQVAYSDLTPTSGFKLLLEAIANWFNPAIASAFLALFVVGVFLATLRLRVPQSLGLCIGCHAAWVWQIKVSKDLFNVNPHADYAFLVSSYDGVVGPFVTLWLTLSLSMYWGWLKSRR